MITKENYGAVLVGLSMALLVFLSLCSFFVSFHIIDLAYAITVIIFCIKYYKAK